MATNFPNSPGNGDTHTFGGVTYTYNSTMGAWTGPSTTAGSGASVTVSENAPSGASEGDLWFDPSVLKTFVYYNDGTANQWVQSNPTGSGGSSGGGASVTASDTAPTSPSAGDLWFKSDTGALYVYYADADSSQWVGISGPTGADGATGATGADGAAASVSYANLAAFPSSPTEGDIAYAQDTNALYVYDGSEWDRISSGSDESPRVTTEPATTHSLNSDGTTSTLTMVAEDPEGFDIEYGIRYNTSGNTLPSQLTSATTINQSTGVYTFTPTTTTSNQGSFIARLTASDGNRVTTRNVNFDLTFYDITSNLLVHYNFENGESWSGSGTSITDLTSNGNNGTITNYSHSRTNLTYSSGAAVFDRQSRISIPVDVDTYSSHTVLAVMKEVSATPDRRMTMGCYNPSTSSGMFVRAGGLAGRPSNGGYVSAGGFTDSYTDGSVFTIGYTLSGGTLTPYRNGSAGSQTLSAASGHVSSRSDYGVGALYDPSFSTDEANLSAGNLYEIRIFNRVLSASDIAGFHTYAQAEHGF